jgi:hypothetical protein
MEFESEEQKKNYKGISNTTLLDRMNRSRRYDTRSFF